MSDAANKTNSKYDWNYVHRYDWCYRKNKVIYHGYEMVKYQNNYDLFG